jgi:hypothetical protein
LNSNASSHSALTLKTFLAKDGVVAISHPPYSPDLAPVNIFSLPYIERKEASEC